MPVVASMGGIAGSQTLTLVIRGMAIGQVGRSNARSLLIKETAVGMINGLPPRDDLAPAQHLLPDRPCVPEQASSRGESVRRRRGAA